MEHLKPGDPSRVGNYRLIGRLGEGGMGQVFLGLSPGGRQVAVKVIHPGYASGKQFRERFAREIEAARRVGGFHTASVVDADPGADPPWMVTAFIQGPSLQQAVAEGGPFSLERVCRLGAGLAEGLAAIHACGLVHRDLKPSNVILADDGPRIIDFGIARAAEASPMTTAGMVVGTYSYMSPEQLRGDVAGPASDVFALGCTLAFAATARITFGDDSIVTVVYRITTEPPDLSGVTEEHGFRELVRDCLSKSPANRPSLATIMDRLAETGTAAQAVLADPVADYWRSGGSASRGAAAEPAPAAPPRLPGPPAGAARARAGAAAAPVRRGRGAAAVFVRGAPGAQAVPVRGGVRLRAGGIPVRGTAPFRAGGIPVRGAAPFRAAGSAGGAGSGSGSIPAGAGSPPHPTSTSRPRPCGPATGPVPARALTSSAPAPRDLRQTSVRSGRPHQPPSGSGPAGGGPAAARAGRC